MKIGVLYCSYNMSEYLEDSLNPWVQARQDRLDGYEFVISAISVPFKEYQAMDVTADNTPELLSTNYLKTHKIDALTVTPQYIPENEGRSLALRHLIDTNCEIVVLWDGDEVASQNDISNILKFISLDRFTSYFKFSYKNYVFTKSQYLAEPFQPPRAFRVKTNGYELDSFVWDNDPTYMGIVVQGGSFVKKAISYRDLPSKIIPPSIAFIPHFSWISNSKSQAKVRYQMEHFKGTCSYRWDEVENCLKFNDEFYKKNNLLIPKVIKE